MVAGTHIAFASLLYVGGAALFEYPTSIAAWAVASAASLGPDIDLPTSRLGRVFFWLSTRLERDFGHRTVTHSALAVLALAILLYPLVMVGWSLVYWAFLGGYWSHIWIDMLNKRGSDLFWPSATRVVMPGNREHRMTTGSKPEMILLVVLVLLTAAVYPLADIGIKGGLQHFLGNFGMALDRYKREAGEKWFHAELEATDNLTLERIKCDCPVIGVWNEGLIIMHNGVPKALGESQTAHNLYPLKVKMMDGPPLNVVSEHIDMSGRTLRWLLTHIDTNRDYFLLGEMQVAGQFKELQELDSYHPAQFSGRVLKLHYAREKQITKYLDMVAAQGEIYIQYWLHEGDPPVRLDFGTGEPESLVPDELTGFMRVLEQK